MRRESFDTDWSFRMPMQQFLSFLGGALTSEHLLPLLSDAAT